jgi:hypothetical protein
VGIFSFLNGKKEDEKDEIRTTDVPRTTAEAPRTTSAAPPAIAADHAPSPDSPFHAPDAWNTEALTAPKPVAAAEKPEMGRMRRPPRSFSRRSSRRSKRYDPEIPVDIHELADLRYVDADSACSSG